MDPLYANGLDRAAETVDASGAAANVDRIHRCIAYASSTHLTIRHLHSYSSTPHETLVIQLISVDRKRSNHCTLHIYLRRSIQQARTIQ